MSAKNKRWRLTPRRPINDEEGRAKIVIDKKALSQKLTELAAKKSDFTDGNRVISDGAKPAPMQAILHAIDETVLDRKLTFRAGASYATVVVAGRRLQGLTKASGNLDGALKVMGKVLSHDDSDLMTSIAAIMQQLVDQGGPVTVQSEDTQKLGTQSDAGVGVNTLADTWAVEMSSEPQTPMSQFIINCGASVNASLVIAQGKIVRAKGDKDIQGRLEHIANDQWGDFNSALGALRKANAEEPALVCLNGGLNDDTSLAVARNDDELSVFVFNSDQLSAVYSKWRETTAA
jgi:hypothetical protein